MKEYLVISTSVDLMRAASEDIVFISSDGNYDMDMAYTPSGRIIWKHRNAQSSSVSETADIYYGYCDDYQPHAVKRMFDHNNGMLYDLRWDEAGNLGQVSIAKPGEMFEAGRFLFWTEDSRMHTAVDDKHYSYYAYDYGGERRLKLVGVNSSVDVNAEYMNASSALNEPTLYPSAYMVLTNKGYTKHYYAGTERVAARLGGGGLDALYHVIENDGELQTKADSLFDQCLEQVNSRVLNENDLECIMRNRFAKEEFGYWIDDIPYQMKADVKFDHDQFKDMVDSMLTDYHNGKEKEVYFYHSDHLGSASWITDSIGIPIQHLQYLPYGEPYIDQRAAGTTYRERFRFTGKERDEETGYGYFGARYMDHELMTMWLSVDPMADKYPSISPYAYCAWNPVKLVDPDGNEISPIFSTEGKLLGTDDEGYKGRSIVMEESSFKQGMDHMEAESKGTYLDEYGSSISISDKDWEKVEANGGTRQKPYLSNKSDERVFYKPDKSHNIFSDASAYPCEPHMDIYMPIDGVKTAEMKRNEVFKVVDDTRVTIRPNRCIPYTFDKNSPRLSIGVHLPFSISRICGQIITGGLLKNAPDSGWIALRDAFVKQ